MKLIYILNHYAHDSSSHFFHIIHLLETMADKGVEIALIIEKCEDLATVRSANIRVYPVNTSKWIRPLVMSGLLFKLSRQGYKRIFIRISWLAACLSIIVAFFTRQQTFYWLSTQGSLEYHRSLRAGWGKLRNWFGSIFPLWFIKTFVFRFVTGPEAMGNYYTENLGVKRSRLMILYNDVDTGRFKPVGPQNKSALRRKWNIPEKSKVILFVHRFSPVRKTAYYFPYVPDLYFEQNPMEDVLFFFAGSGPERARIEDVFSKKSYRQNIHFAGAIPNAGIHELYQLSDIFIQPSMAEGFPRTLIEAMACGLPVVTTSAGGVHDILGPLQKQYILEMEDRAGFVKCLSDLTADESKREKLASENLEYSGKFSTGAVSEMYINRIFTR